MDVAIDTSVLVGLLVPNDHWHKQAVKLWEATKAQGYTPVYLDCVAAETISVIVRRLEGKGLSAEIAGAIRRWEEHIPTGSISWVLPDVPRLYPQIIALIRSSSGALNFNDALIALACRERGIEAIASFDEDFDQVDWLRRLARAEDLKG
jgi:predicted nucleic acid-binding protein